MFCVSVYVFTKHSLLSCTCSKFILNAEIFKDAYKLEWIWMFKTECVYALLFAFYCYNCSFQEKTQKHASFQII